MAVNALVAVQREGGLSDLGRWPRMGTVDNSETVRTVRVTRLPMVGAWLALGLASWAIVALVVLGVLLLVSHLT